MGFDKILGSVDQILGPLPGVCLVKCLGKVFKVLREVLATSWGHSGAFAGGGGGGGLSNCSPGLGQILRAVLGDCIRMSLGTFAKSLGCLGHIRATFWGDRL